MGRRPRVRAGPQNLRTVTLRIIVVSYEHDLSEDLDEEKESRRYRRGDVIDVLLTPPHATRDGNDWHWNEPISSPRFGLIHMRDVPEKRWQNMRKRFTEPLLEGNVPGAERTDEGKIARRRRWRFDIPKLQIERPPKHNELINNRETTMLYDQARMYLYKKTYHDKKDQKQDTYDLLEDADLPET